MADKAASAFYSAKSRQGLDLGGLDSHGGPDPRQGFNPEGGTVYFGRSSPQFHFNKVLLIYIDDEGKITNITSRFIQVIMCFRLQPIQTSDNLVLVSLNIHRIFGENQK